jgi:glycosyltransferase involved in cell wall biosynthesis
MECGIRAKQDAVSLRIAYIHARPGLNDARLKYMPFGLSLVKMLDRAGHAMDLYLAEQSNQGYQALLSQRSRQYFLDHKVIWERPGRVNYWLLNSYFRYFSRANTRGYDLVIASGQAGCVLGHALARQIDRPFVYLNDEFPEIYSIPIWKAAEARAACQADLIVVPDEVRFSKLCEQIKGIEGKLWATLPNTPLWQDLDPLPSIDWHQRLGLPQGSKIFLLAGGIWDFNGIAEAMFTVREWPKEAILLINGRESRHNPISAYSHLEEPGRIFWHLELLDDPEFHSLVRYSTASFGLYRNLEDLSYVGKSSGKILRSIACGRPVIASRFDSLAFLEEEDIGVLVHHPREIPKAVSRILTDPTGYSARCQKAYREKLSFEIFWPAFEQCCETLGCEL